MTSPAYDVIPAAERADLARSDPYNIVRLILPLDEPGTPDKYAAAGATLQQWQSSGVLTTAPKAAVYAYEMSDPRDDGQATPTFGLLAQVPVLPRDDGGVLPHEDVWTPVVEDRARLTAATHANLEPVVLAVDLDAAEWPDLLDVRRTPAPVDFVSDDVRHRLWPIADPAALTRLSSVVAGRQAVIADGHHRWAAYQQVRTTDTPGSAAALAFLVPVTGAGLRVRAIHRLLPELSAPDVVERLVGTYSVRDISAQVGIDPEGAAREALRLLACSPPYTVVVTDGSRWWEASDPDPAAVTAAAAGGHTAERNALDVSVLHDLLVPELLGRRADRESLDEVEPVYDALPAARQLADGRRGTLLLLRSATPADVLRVARAGDRMPRKSTLFVPKPRTGLVLRRFADNADGS